MTIVLWDWLEHLDFLVGAEFPEADEDALWRSAQAWAEAAAQARSVVATAGQAGAGVLSALSGESAASFDELWADVAGPDGFLSQIAAACDDLGAACDGAAAEVEYAKLQYIGALVALATTLALIAATIEFGGVSALGIPGAVAATQLTIRLILMRLLSAVALSVSFTVAMDSWAQLTQILEGHRREWDVDKTIRAVADGAIYGVVGGGVFLGVGRVAPDVLRTMTGLAGTTLVAGGVGGAVAPLAHGEVPTGRDVLMAMTSSLAGAGPDLARPPAPDLTALSAVPVDGLSRLRDLDVGLSPDRLTVDLPRLDGAQVGEVAPGMPADTHEAPNRNGLAGYAIGEPAPSGSIMDRRSVGLDAAGPAAPSVGGVAPVLGSGAAPGVPPAVTPSGEASHLPASGVGLAGHTHLTSAVSVDSTATGSGDWRARGGDRYPFWSENGATLSGKHNRFADSLLARAAVAEAELTPQVRDVAVAVGGVLRGEENAIKTASSLKEKLAFIFPRSSMSAALLRANDTLRYTIQLPDDGYAAGARATVDGLLERGLRPVKELRGWAPDRSYLGLNTTWSDPATGHVFEVQLHTEASYYAKTVSHGLYREIRRLERLGGDPALIASLRMEHDAYFADVPIPAGAAEVGLPRTRYDPRNDLPADPAPRLPESDLRVPATDAEALDLVRETAAETDAGLSFYAADDEMRDFAAAVPATDGYLSLDLHGSPAGFRIRDRLLTPSQLAVALRELAADGRVDLSQGIKLISCDTAAGGTDSPAAELARELGVEVLAPDQPVWTAMDGTVLVSSPRLVEGFIVPTLPPDGRWVRFDPGGMARETYAGGTFGLVDEGRPDRTGGAQPRAPDQ